MQREPRRARAAEPLVGLAARPDGPGSRRSRTRRSSPRTARCGRSACAAASPSGSARNRSSSVSVVRRAGSAISPAPRTRRSRARSMPRLGDAARANSSYMCSSQSRAVAALGERRPTRRAARPGRRRSRSRRAPRRTARRRGHGDEVAVAARRPRCRRARASSWPAARCRRAAPSRSRTARARRRCRAAPNAAAQPVQVLVVVERVAAGPVHEPDVGVGVAAAVVVEGLARVSSSMSAIRATGMNVSTGLRPCGRRRQRIGDSRLPASAIDAVAVAEAAAGQADLAEQRGQRDAHPHRLLAVLGALQRLADGDERAAAGHPRARSEIVVGGDAGDARPPTRGLRLPVRLAEDVGDRAGRAPTQYAVEELAVVQALGRPARGRAPSITAVSVPGHDRVPARARRRPAGRRAAG